MKIYYIVSAELAGKTCYLSEDEDNNGKMRCPAHTGNRISVSLFATEAAAHSAIDDLRHGIGRHCKVVSVTVG